MYIFKNKFLAFLLGLHLMFRVDGDDDGGNGDDTPQTPEGYVPKADHEAAVNDLTGQLTAARNETSGRWVNDDGSFKEGFTEHLSDDLKGDPVATKYTSVEAMMRAHKSLQSMIGSNTVKIPGEHASDEDIRIYRETMGIPMDSDGYTFEKPAEMPEGVDFDEAGLSEFQQFANTLGLTQEQFAKIVEFDIARNGKAVKQIGEQDEALKAQWRAEAEEQIGEKGMLKAKKVANWLSEQMTTDPNNPVDILNDPIIANTPMGMQMLSTFGSLFSEGQLPTDPSELSLQDVQSQIDEIYSNPNHPYHAGDKAAENKMRELMLRKNGG